MNEPIYPIHGNIKAEREVRGWSLQELSNVLKAKGVRITAPTIQRYETGEIVNIPYKSVIALAEAFNMDPAILMGFSRPSEADLAIDKLRDSIKDQLNDSDKENIVQIISIYCDLPDSAKAKLLEKALELKNDEKLKLEKQIKAQMAALQAQLDALKDE